MNLLDLTETRCDEHAAVRHPVEKRRLARVLITPEPSGERGIRGWDTFQNEIAALLVRGQAWRLLGLGRRCGKKQARG